MLIRFLVNTNYKGSRKVGEELEVSEDIAMRWERNGLVEIVEVEEEEEDIVLEDLSTKELYKLCVSKDLEVEPKKSKEYYIEALTSEVSEETDEEIDAE